MAVWKSVPAEEVLDHHLASLPRCTSTGERMAILEQVAAYWYGPASPGEGSPTAAGQGVELPAPLQWLLTRYGGRPGFLEHPNHVPPLDHLTPDRDGKLVFLVEEQGVYVWGTTTTGDDPPVWGRLYEEEGAWVQECTHLTEFLIAAVVNDEICAAEYGASTAWVDQETLDGLIEVLPPLPLEPWRCPYYPTRYYGRGGVFMAAAPNGIFEGRQGYLLWLGSRHKEAVKFLHEIADDDWDYRAY